MPRSPSTRTKGSGIPAGGAGHGGDARGGQSNSKAGVPGPGCLGVPPGEGKAAVKAATFRETLEPHYAAIAEKWKNIALNDAHPHQHTMIIKAGELAGEFKQALEISGPEGGPIEVESARDRIARRLAGLAAVGAKAGDPS